MEAIETFQHNGKTIEIHQDENIENIRESCDHLDIMVCFHKRYSLGDKNHGYCSTNFNTWEELENKIIEDHKPIAIVPLYLYDHSGITINTTGFSCPWDSGQIGFSFIPRNVYLKEFERKRSSKKLEEKAMNYLLDSVEEYRQCLEGEVYGYVIKNPENNEILESCWGFYGLDFVRQSAKKMADSVKIVPKEDPNQLQLALS